MMVDKYICPICGNSDIRYIGNRKGTLYCRRCLDFEFNQVDSSYVIKKDKVKYTLEYPLTNKQEEIANIVLEYINDGFNVLIHAVTGAGKTELVFKSIYNYLKLGKKVGFATPRKDVVIELVPRFEKAFNNLKITAVYGENNDILEGDIIILTTHQLCHYNSYFDLLVVDEIDAFPFENNFVLNSLFYKSLSSSGNYILLTATISEKDKKEFLSKGNKVVNLNQRFHEKDLIVPKFIFSFNFPNLLPIYHLYKLLKHKRKVLVFCPTISRCYQFFNICKVFLKKGECVHSKRKERADIIADFKNGKYDYLVTTSILERGVTIKDLDVIIVDVDNSLFSWQAIVQISGRVGRKLNSEKGVVLLFGFIKTKEVIKSIEIIRKHNKEKYM